MYKLDFGSEHYCLVQNIIVAAQVLGVPLRLGRADGPERMERREETLAIGPEARKRVRYSVAGRELIDTLDAVRRYDFVVRDLPSHGLKDVARYFGIATPDRVYLEGATIFETYRRDPERVRQYALDDVQEVDGLSQRLLGASYALAGMAPRRYERLASAGPAMGILEPMLVRAYLRAGAALPQRETERDSTHGLHEGGAAYLFASGREVLAQVLGALRDRGMALIEADTDGVYFAVPAAWTEEQERQLVAEIGAELPTGIRLEYEGRYRAMFSHEVKNYALLTYGDQLIVHGVALRSSRAEPFGERFLRQALLCTMTGDVIGVRNVYLETAKALRGHMFPVSDVAARVRLSKSPEAYQAARTAHTEQAYEALLAAGRTKWTPGERVRFYRALGGASVWVPDESEEISFEEAGEAGVRAGRQEQNALLLLSYQDEVTDRHGYDVEHYLRVLVTSYASRLRKAYSSEDFEQLFRIDDQLGLFDRPIEHIHPIWIRCQG